MTTTTVVISVARTLCRFSDDVNFIHKETNVIDQYGTLVHTPLLCHRASKQAQPRAIEGSAGRCSFAVSLPDEGEGFEFFSCDYGDAPSRNSVEDSAARNREPPWAKAKPGFIQSIRAHEISWFRVPRIRCPLQASRAKNYKASNPRLLHAHGTGGAQHNNADHSASDEIYENTHAEGAIKFYEGLTLILTA